MKSIAFGCLGVVLGLVVGAILAIAATQFAGSANLQPTVAPTILTSQSDVSITASAAFMNSQLQQAVKQSGLAKQATITLAPPNLIQVATAVDASAFGLPVTVNATVALRVLVQRGRIVLEVAKVDAGGVAVAQSAIGPSVEKMRVAAENQINQLVQRALQGTALRVSNVRVTPSDLSIDLVNP